jgi:hypothetical protein
MQLILKIERLVKLSTEISIKKYTTKAVTLYAGLFLQREMCIFILHSTKQSCISI